MSPSLVSAAVGVVGALLAGALTAWAFRQTDRVPQTVEGDAFVMRYAPLLGWLGWFCIAFSGGLLVLFVFDPNRESPLDVLGVAAVTGMFVVPGVLILLSAKRTYAVARPDGFALHTWFRSEPVEVRWSEVEEVTFSRLGYLLVRTRGGRKVRLSAYFVGIYQLADLVAGSLRVPGAHEAAAKLREFRKAYGG